MLPSIYADGRSSDRDIGYTEGDADGVGLLNQFIVP